jgi:MurNAc alpha-1-phosphate uridylyltransferase
MKAMILAAGRGERMRPLTDTRPKALLGVGGKALIEWHLEKLAAAGFSAVVINHAHLGALIEAALGDGKRYGVPILYSPESDALETAGGIAQALPLLGDAPFAVVNADVYSDFDYAGLADAVRRLARNEANALAHLVLVPNPEHHADGDFALEDGFVASKGAHFTFSGISAYQPALFNVVARGSKAPLAPLLRKHIPARRITGELCAARWCDVGTPARLAALERELAARSP